MNQFINEEEDLEEAGLPVTPVAGSTSLNMNKKEAEAEKIIKKYGEPKGFPTFYLVNSDGSLRDSWSGYSKTFFLNKVEELLNLKN